MIQRGHGDRLKCCVGICERDDHSLAHPVLDLFRVTVLPVDKCGLGLDPRSGMTLAEWLAFQAQMMDAFGWLVRWWLIGLLVGGVFAAIITWTVITTREMVSKI